MQIYGQRDKKWASIGLGTSKTTTIGSHGCTITCLAMLAGLTPDVVNQRMKDADAFASTNLVIWGKIKDAIPHLEFDWRGYTYENDRVSKAIEEHGGCLVEVDFDGTGRDDDRHWVLYIGNKKLYDPWTGTERPTSVYKKVMGYAIIKTLDVPPVETPNKPTDREEADRNWNGWVALSNEAGIPPNPADKDKMQFEGVEAIKKLKEDKLNLSIKLKEEQDKNKTAGELITEDSKDNGDTTQELINAQKALEPYKSTISKINSVLALSAEATIDDTVEAVMVLRDQKTKYKGVPAKGVFLAINGRVLIGGGEK